MPSDTPPSPAEIDREHAEARREAILAGHRNDATTARRLLDHPAAVVREAAIGALERSASLTAHELSRALTDPDSRVIRRAVEAAAHRSHPALAPLLELTPEVVEATCWALGERQDRSPDTVAALVRVAEHHEDSLCRESAVAALGAVGDEAGRSAVLAAMNDKATVRRRAVLALAAFDGPEVEAALAAALTDRDWQVRQAAEDLLDRP